MRLTIPLGILCILLSGVAVASPSLVSGPLIYDTGGSGTPVPAADAPTITCSYQENTSPVVSVPATPVSSNDSAICKWDLASVTRAVHAYQVWAGNMWGQSAKVPFGFSAVAPAGMTGLRVTP
jgi:hypothetical protein